MAQHAFSKAACTLKADKFSRSSHKSQISKRNNTQQVLRPIEFQFADAARRYSQDGSASAGGELGWVSPGQLVPEFEQAMSQLKPGEVSQPIQSQFGVHLIQVEGRREAEVPVDRQRDYARSVIREQKVQSAYEDWLRQLRDAAHVEYRVNRQQ